MLNTKNYFFNQAISEENYGVALNFFLRGAIFDGLSRTKLDQIIKETNILDDDYARVLVSRGSDLTGIGKGQGEVR